MQFDIGDYIRVTTKYLLLFKSISDTAETEYLVYNSLKETGLENFLIGCESKTVVSALIRESSGVHDKNTCTKVFGSRKYPSYKRNVCYTNEILGLGRKKYKTYVDFVNANIEDMSFVVIKVPLTVSLFRKLVKLSMCNIREFTSNEIHEIFTHLYPFQDKQGLLAYVTCMHLQNNASLVSKLKECHEAEDNSGFNEQIRFLSTCIFDTVDGSMSFVEMVNQNIEFRFRGEGCFYGQFNRKIYSKKDIQHELELSSMVIGFLFNYLDLHYDYLEDNMHALVNKFNGRGAQSRLVLRITYISDKINNIYCEMENTDMFSAADILLRKINTISEFVYRIEHNIRDVILEFSEVNTSVDSSWIHFITALSTIQCDRCSVDFVGSIPKDMLTVEVDFYSTSDNKITNISQGIAIARYYDAMFHGHLVFSGAQRQIIINGKEIQGSLTFAPNEKYEKIKISDIIGNVCLSNIAGINRITWNTHEYSNKLSYKKKDNGKSSLKLVNARICDSVILDMNIDALSFKNVYFGTNQEFVFVNTNISIHISESYGLYDLTPFFGIKLDIQRSTKLVISPIQDDEMKLSRLELSGSRLHRTVKLSNIFKHVKLSNIFIVDDFSFILNAQCKELVLDECAGTIDFTGIKQLDMVKITFSHAESIYATSENPASVRDLRLHCINQTPEALQNLLLNFKDIERLQILNSGRSTFYTSSSPYKQDIAWLFEYECPMNTTMPLSMHLLAEHSDHPHIKGYIKSSLVVNFVWTSFISECAASTLQELDLSNTIIMKDNWESLSKLINLKILKLCVDNLTDAFFKNLPPSIRLLKLSGMTTRDMEWNVEDKFCCSNPLVALPNLRILQVDPNFIPIICHSDSMPRSLEAIQVRLTHRFRKASSMARSKFKISELYISDEDDITGDYNKSVGRKVQALLNFLSNYVEFTVLDHLMLVSSSGLSIIDPVTYEILNKAEICVPEGFGEDGNLMFR